MVVIVYDIPDNKRRTKLAHFLEGYGDNTTRVLPPSPQIWGSNSVKSPSIGGFRRQINNKPPLTEQYWVMEKEYNFLYFNVLLL
jgi:hypothetical protein